MDTKELDILEGFRLIYEAEFPTSPRTFEDLLRLRVLLMEDGLFTALECLNCWCSHKAYIRKI